MMFVLNTICYQQNYVILLRVNSKSRPTCRAGLRVPNKADFNFNKDTLLERKNEHDLLRNRIQIGVWTPMARLGALSGEPLLPSTLFQGGCLFFGLYFVTHAAGGDPSCFTSALFFFSFLFYLFLYFHLISLSLCLYSLSPLLSSYQSAPPCLSALTLLHYKSR